MPKNIHLKNQDIIRYKKKYKGWMNVKETTLNGYIMNQKSPRDFFLGGVLFGCTTGVVSTLPGAPQAQASSPGSSEGPGSPALPPTKRLRKTPIHHDLKCFEKSLGNPINTSQEW